MVVEGAFSGGGGGGGVTGGGVAMLGGVTGVPVVVPAAIGPRARRMFGLETGEAAQVPTQWSVEGGAACVGTATENSATQSAAESRPDFIGGNADRVTWNFLWREILLGRTILRRFV